MSTSTALSAVQRQFAAEVHRLGFALDPDRAAPALVLQGTSRRCRAAIVFRPSGAIDYAATMRQVQAAYGAHVRVQILEALQQATARMHAASLARTAMSKQPAFEILDTDYPAVDTLPEDQRLALLSYHRGNSYAAIADMNGIAPGTVRSRIFRARAKILAARAAAGAPETAEATP